MTKISNLHLAIFEDGLNVHFADMKGTGITYHTCSGTLKRSAIKSLVKNEITQFGGPGKLRK